MSHWTGMSHWKQEQSVPSTNLYRLLSIACYTFPVPPGRSSMQWEYPVLLPLRTLLGHLCIQFRNLQNQRLNDNDNPWIPMVSDRFFASTSKCIPCVSCLVTLRQCLSELIPQVKAPISHKRSAWELEQWCLGGHTATSHCRYLAIAQKSFRILN